MYERFRTSQDQRIRPDPAGSGVEHRDFAPAGREALRRRQSAYRCDADAETLCPLVTSLRTENFIPKPILGFALHCDSWQRHAVRDSPR